MTRVDLDVTTWHNNDGEDSNEPYSYRGTTSGSVDGVRILKKNESSYGWSYRGLETDLEPPFYVAYATYYTGDTFGSDFDAVIIGVTKTEDDIIALVEEAENFTGYGSLSSGVYVPWNGYFESLIGVNYERLA